MSIKESALIVSLVINQPTKSRTDKSALHEVAEQHGVNPEALNLVKELYPKALLSPIETVIPRARHFVRVGTYKYDA